ncbi:MAG TPA: GNAT family N-acetyltransferase [Prolixibacteraceae bacterium]|nr:GNAT family N-acetyltransferase [Prolixibacteraceae bacterium]HPT31488.1 GNAT family N-acetyltransferase [Prolixibacteraceae bacterium]
MKVREAIKEDASAIVSFQLAMAAETEQLMLDPEVVDKGVSAVFEDPKKGRYYVTELNGEVIASLMTTFEWSDWRNGTVMWIQSVYVLPQYRRRGVYRKMYSFLQNLVYESNDLKGIRLYVDKSNTRAQATYWELGMNAEHYQTFEWMK